MFNYQFQSYCHMQLDRWYDVSVCVLLKCNGRNKLSHRWLETAFRVLEEEIFWRKSSEHMLKAVDNTVTNIHGKIALVNATMSWAFTAGVANNKNQQLKLNRLGMSDSQQREGDNLISRY